MNSNDRSGSHTVDRHAYHNYRILEHVEQTPLLTIRSIARKLSVSVKLAHELLGRLVKKGMLHVRKRHARRWDYFLTPEGLMEKARLTCQFLDFSMQFYREARRRSAEVLAGAAREGMHRIAFLGATELAEIASLGAREWGLDVVDVFDDALAGKGFLALTVRPVGEIRDSTAERILVTAFDPQEPMSRRYLPEGADDDSRFLWIFDLPEGAASAAPGNAPHPDSGGEERLRT